MGFLSELRGNGRGDERREVTGVASAGGGQRSLIVVIVQWRSCGLGVLVQIFGVGFA